MGSRWAQQSWASIAVEHLVLLYGPRFGRFYLVSPAQADDRWFQRILGLSRQQRLNTLHDPAAGVMHARAQLDLAPTPPERGLCRAYRSMHASRHLMSLRSSVRILRWAAHRARGRRAPPGDASSIARQVHGAERALGFSDCYPRALLTTYLALRAGIGCTLAVGALAPTRKMHAWCSLNGVVPYEPRPEHYLYQPTWTLDLAPRG